MRLWDRVAERRDRRKVPAVDYTALPYPDSSFDKVVAGNVIHLLDNPLTALSELNRVCKDGGMLIIPTYMNKDDKGKTNGFSDAVGKADGRIPCAVAVMRKK